MRIVIDSLIGLMLVGVVATALYLHHQEKQDEQTVAQVRDALSLLDEKTDYQTAVQSAMSGQDTLIVHIDPEWFGDATPQNSLLDDEHPWIDLAPPGDLGVHPPDPVVTGPKQAGFWYNPTVGVFRARVTPQASEAKTLALYNKVNDTVLPGFEQLPDPGRAPVAHVPGRAPAKRYASMANQTWSKPEVRTDAEAAAEQRFESADRSADEGDVLGTDNGLEPPPRSRGVFEVPAGYERDALTIEAESAFVERAGPQAVEGASRGGAEPADEARPPRPTLE